MHITPPGLQEQEQSEHERRAAAWHRERAQQQAPKFCDKCGERATFWIGGKPLTYLCGGCAAGVNVKLWTLTKGAE